MNYTNSTFVPIEEHPSAWIFVIVTRVCLATALFILLVLLSIHSWRLIEIRKTHKHVPSLEKELHIILFVQNIASILLLIDWAVLGFIVPWPFGQEVCTSVSKSVALFYAAALQATFLFLIAKASMVSGFEKRRWFTFLSWATKRVLLIFLPFFALPVTLYYAVGVLTEEGICIVVIPELWYTGLFLVGCFFISSACTFLFVSPIYNMTTDAKTLTAAHVAKYRQVVRYNLIVSSIMIGSTILCLTTDLIAWTIMVQHPEYLYFGKLVDIANAIDFVVTCICSRLMTSIWLPTRFVKKDSTSTDDGNTLRTGQSPVLAMTPLVVSSDGDATSH